MATRSRWFSLLFLSVSWLSIVPINEPPSPAVWAALVLSAVVLSACSFLRTPTSASWRFFALPVVPAAVAAALIPAPYSLGPALLLIGCLVAIAGVGGGGTDRPVLAIRSRIASVGAGVVFAGVIASLQAAVIAPYVMLASRYNESGYLGRVAIPLLRLAGVKARSGAEGLLLHTGVQTLTYSLTWEKFGALVSLLFVVGAVPVLALARRDKLAFPLLLLLAYLYAEFRFMVLALMYAAGGRIDVFWSVPVTLLTFLLLPVVASAFFRVPAQQEIELPDPPVRSRSFWLGAGLVCLATVVLLGSVAFDHPGAKKSGRVIMDEGHSDWEWSAEALDTEWYGEKSGYNYYNLYEYLDLFYQMQRNTKPITEKLLADCDVLILKMPTTAFKAEEVAAIVKFVRGGGGLWLIGDHTNVFGTSTYINPLADQFGLHFEPTATYDLTTGNLSEYHAPKVLPHPIVQNLPGTFLFATSSTLKASPDARGAIVGYGLKSLEADYSETSFFPAKTAGASPEMQFGGLLQGATVRVGRGRVAAFADSTVFSNFWMFMPGKPELALSNMEWLNRSNTVPDTRLPLAALAVVLTALAVYMLRRAGARTVALAICIGLLLGIPAGIYLWGAVNRASYPLPVARRAYTSIAFERKYSKFEIPSTIKGFMADPALSLHTFYVWTQRLGYIPSAHDSLGEALAAGTAVVIANPIGTPSDEDVAALRGFVDKGGRLLVMGSSEASSSADAFLDPFGMRVDRTSPAVVTVSPKDGDDPLRITRSAGIVVGGSPLVSTTTSDVICAYARKGRGLVIAFSDSRLFANTSMGDSSSVPDYQQGQIGDLEFALMRFLAEDKTFGF
jgi:hypothetical protein